MCAPPSSIFMKRLSALRIGAGPGYEARPGIEFSFYITRRSNYTVGSPAERASILDATAHTPRPRKNQAVPRFSCHSDYDIACIRNIEYYTVRRCSTDKIRSALSSELLARCTKTVFLTPCWFFPLCDLSSERIMLFSSKDSCIKISNEGILFW